MKYYSVILAAVLCLFSSSASAQIVFPPNSQFIFFDDIVSLDSPENSAALIVNNPTGPDQLFLNMNLDPNTRYTVFLGTAEDTTNGAGELPIVFLGEFTTDSSGNSGFSVTVEIVNARASHNANPAFKSSLTDLPTKFLAAALGNGAFSVPLSFIRVYRAEGNISVFGPTVIGNTFTPGGGLVTTTLAKICRNFDPNTGAPTCP